ncbi:hypothetical protein [Budvicia diplopodorum]|uniref:hypothetical protein n=1 Tax=Budvicia diplopodorum TaxID=1119056 RepID=UPI0013581969|nr:hypothetical protein [Budvicia diplopodorum]
MKSSFLAVVALLACGCHNDLGVTGCQHINDRPIYRYDPETKISNRDYRQERIRDQGACDNSTDQGAVFGQ